jgi:hypothetical protein
VAQDTTELDDTGKNDIQGLGTPLISAAACIIVF